MLTFLLSFTVSVLYYISLMNCFTEENSVDLTRLSVSTLQLLFLHNLPDGVICNFILTLYDVIYIRNEVCKRKN